MRFPILLLLAFMGLASEAGSFDTYHWRMGFLVGEGYYQATIRIKYEYDASSGFNPTSLAIPNDDNLKVYKVNFKVDGQKVGAVESQQVTWWSYGRPVSVLLPEKEGTKVSVNALFVVKNLFLIPPGPTHLPEPVKKLEVGFAPLHGFNFTGTFVGKEFKFKSKKVAARTGEPPFVYGIWRKNVKANPNPGMLFLIPKSFTFSFNDLRAATKGDTVIDGSKDTISGIYNSLALQTASAGSGNADTIAGQSSFSMGGDLRAYTATFYHGNPIRDWVFALTWLQQERTYLPFGIQPGGRVASRSLFAGAGNKTDDLIPWMDVAATTFNGDALVAAPSEAPMAEMDVVEATSMVETVELFLQDYRRTLPIDFQKSRLIAYQDKDGKISPAMANRGLANELNLRYGLKAVPALTSIFPRERVAALPLAAFNGIVTAVKIDRGWFFVDAGNPNWNMANSMLFLKGHSVVILDEGNIQMGGF